MAETLVTLTWTLDDRLLASDSGPSQPEPRVDGALSRWQEISANGDPARFARRLALDGLDEVAVSERLKRLPDGVPPWLEIWTAAMAVWTTPEPGDDPGIPFGPVFQPFATFALERLARRSPAGWARLSEAARADLAQGLRGRLSAVASQALFEDYHQRQSVAFSSPIALLMAAMNGTTDLFQAFVAAQDRDCWEARVARLPVLARSIGMVIQQWIESHGEWLDRLDHDWQDLNRHFDLAGPVATVGCNLSDAHRQGRSVLSVTFANGRRLAYKPKDLAIEARFSDLLGWLNERRILPLDLKGLDVLERDGYGWVLWVDHQPCADDEAVSRFYRRAGMLLCLVYLLEGTDCHYENVVAHGEHPVLIDGETLFMPRVHLGQATDEAMASQVERAAYSVLRTGFLPGWAQREQDKLFEAVCGLGGAEDGELPAVRQWVAVNTDVMAYDEAPLPEGPKTHLPVVDGRRPSLAEHRDSLLAGFTDAYRSIWAHRDALLAPDGPFGACRGVPVRLVMRATRIYATLLSQQTFPDRQRDGLEWSLGFDRLSLPFTRPEAELRYWPAIAVERQALCELNVPYFEVPSDATFLPLPDGPLPDAFAQSGWDASRSLILAMDEENLQRQQAIIAESLPQADGVTQEERRSDTGTAVGS